MKFSEPKFTFEKSKDTSSEDDYVFDIESANSNNPKVQDYLEKLKENNLAEYYSTIEVLTQKESEEYYNSDIQKQNGNQNPEAFDSLENVHNQNNLEGGSEDSDISRKDTQRYDLYDKYTDIKNSKSKIEPKPKPKLKTKKINNHQVRSFDPYK